MISFPRSTFGRCVAYCACAAAVALAAIGAGEAAAQSAVQGVPNAMQGFSQNRDQPIQIEAAAQSAVQGVPNAMQGFSQNRDQPIQIEAATLEMRDKKKEATFAGNVKVVQGDTTMTSKTLVVFYDSATAAAAPADSAKSAKTAPIQAATPGPGGSSSIRRLEAKGNVVVTQKDQVVTGETAVFDTKANLITMLGGVVLTQCKNVLRGDRLLVDMTTGVSRVESDNGRVQGLFIQSGQGCSATTPTSGPPLPSLGTSNKPK